MKKLLTLLALLAWVGPLAAQTTAPTLIPFQGRLTDQNGVAYTNNQYTIVFQLYDQAVGGTLQWSERHEKVGVLNGMVNVFLGSITPLTNVTFSSTRYLGITVDGDNNPNTPDPEMVPRQMIIPAFWARNSDKLAGYDWSPIFGSNNPSGTIPGAKIAPGSIDATRLAGNAVANLQLQPGAITTDKLSQEVRNQLGGGAGGGGGAVNYVTTGVGDSISGWLRYQNPAQAYPSTGDGGTNLTLTWQRGTNGYLRQGNEFLLGVPGGASLQGQGVSTDFTIDAADQTRTLTISYDAMVLSPGYNAGDLRVYIIAAPGTTNATLIEPVGTQVPAAAVGLPFQGRATFQALNGVTRYRLCLHAATTSTAGYTMAFDTFSVGPQMLQYGAPVTDWQSYTPIIQGFGIPTAVDVYWRRVGSDIQVRGSFTSGTVSASEARIYFPPGLSSTKETVENNVVGTYGRNALVANHGGLILKQNSAGYVCMGPADGFSATVNDILAPQGASAVNSSNTRISFEFFCPIQGWSSSVQMSSDSADGRVVATSFDATGTVATGGTPKILAPTFVRVDTHGGITTGAGGFYEVKVSGIYEISAQVSYQSSTANTSTLGIGVNTTSSMLEMAAKTSAAVYDTLIGTVLLSLSSGDKIYLLATQNSGISQAINLSRCSIRRLSGPSTIAASESVVATATNTSGQSIPNGINTVITGWTKNVDSHGSLNANTGVYTAAVSGKFSVSSVITLAGAVATSTSGMAMWINKNGALSRYLGIQYSFTSVNVPFSVNGSQIIDLVAGDTISIGVSHNFGGVRTLSTDGTCAVSIHRIGN